MKKKIYIPSIIFLFIICFFLLVATQPAVDGFLFEQIPYNYTSSVNIPSHSGNASMQGFFDAYGKGKNFNFHIMLPGAEKAESPLDYTSNGITGQGTIENIGFNFNMIKSVLMMDLKGVFFNTKLAGVFNMSCAAWTGNGTFYNDGKNFVGTFTIHGQRTNYWGNYSLQRENNHIAIISDFDYINWYRNETIPKHVHNVITF